MKVTLTGSNGFALKSELDRLVSAFVEEHGDLALERLDGEEASFERIQEAVQSLPFLAPKKMVVIKRGSSCKQLTEEIDRILDTIPETTELILVEPKLDKRLSYYKTLKAKTRFQEFGDMDGSNLASWLVKSVKEQGGNLSLADARYLVDRVGANQQLLAGELEKLLNYEPAIKRETIDLLTEQSPQSTIFELLDAAFAGNSKQALKLYADQRAQQMEPQYIMAMLAWQLHILAIVKTGGQRSPEEIAREAKLNPYVVRKSQQVTRRLSLPALKDMVGRALDLDVRLKSESIDADEALQHFLLTLSG